MHIISLAASDPKVDVEKMSALLEMKRAEERWQAEVEFYAALSRLLPRLPRIQKSGAIPDNQGHIRSRYARYEDIDLAIRPLLAEEGFSISFRTEEPTPGSIRVIGTLGHRMGHSRESSVTVPIAAPPRATATQAVGSSVSYAKRYVVTNLLNIIAVGEDDDGRGSVAAPITQEQALTIETLIQDTKANRPKFLKWAGVDEIEQILASDYQRVVTGLQAKARTK